MNEHNSQETSRSCVHADLMKARVSKQLKQQFTQAALAQGRSPAEALRQAMAEWVQRTQQAA